MTTTLTAKPPTERVLAWEPGRGLAVADDTPGGALLTADSWLVRDGRARALGRHRERFLRSCAEATPPSTGPSPRQLAAFWRDAVEVLPREGSWFPRVELSAEKDSQPVLRLRLRTAPPLASEVRVWAAGQPDPRTIPRRKGPDLGVLADLRRKASGEGAEEAVLTTPSGLVLEAANSSVLWWEDGTLCLPSPKLRVLAGVTTALIQERAHRTGIRIAHRQRTMEHLAEREVWLVNALHGIRPVTSWLGGDRPMPAGPAPRAAQWQKWLDCITTPLPAR